MRKIDREQLLSAVKDMFLTDSYDDYSVADEFGGSPFIVTRIEGEDWRDEGFSVYDESEDDYFYFQVEGIDETEEKWVFEKGKVIERLVDACLRDIFDWTETAEFEE